MKITSFLLFGFSSFIFAQEHGVPSGTDGNKLVLAVKNAFPISLHEIQVAIQSAPTWVIFEDARAVIDSIPPQTWREASFTFRVLKGSDKPAVARFSISDAHGRLLGTREIKLCATTATQSEETKLDNPYPNPANPSANIPHVLPAPARIKIEIYNMLGQRVRSLLDAERPAGILSETWDGRDDHGLPLASGTYLVRLTTREKGKDREAQFTSKVIVQK